MARSSAKAVPLKPEIKLAQALSEFEAILQDHEKAELGTYRSSPRNSTDVNGFTAEIARDAARNRTARQYVGTRLTNVLHVIQKFSTFVGSLIGKPQALVAGTIWDTVKLSLQVIAILVRLNLFPC